MTKAVIYTRVSDTRGRRDILQSHLEQSERCEALCKAKDWKVVRSIEELDVSGATMDRPGFKRALAMVESGQADVIVVFNLKRFGRTLEAGLVIERIVEELNANVASVEDGIDLSTAAGRLVANVMISFAHYELEIIKGNWRTYRRKTIERGLSMGSLPLGFNRQWQVLGPDSKRRRRQSGPYVVDEKTAPIVVGLFERSAAGASLQAMREWAFADYGVRLTDTRIHSVLRNRIYLGELRHGPNVKIDAHPALVDPLLFERAQRNGVRFSSNAKPRLLTGLSRCAGCRASLKVGRDRNGTQEYYACKNGMGASGRCTAPAYISAGHLEAHVEREFKAWLAARQMRLQNDHGVARLRELDRLAAAKARERQEWESPKVRRTLQMENWLAGATELDDELEQINLERSELAESIGGIAELDALTPEGYDREPLDTRRRLLGLGINVVFVRPTKARGPAAALPPAVAERTRLVWHPHTVDVPHRGTKRFDYRPFVWED